jgi:hypothetical protein
MLKGKGLSGPVEAKPSIFEFVPHSAVQLEPSLESSSASRRGTIHGSDHLDVADMVHQASCSIF